MTTAIQVVSTIILFSVIVGAMIGWCIGAWRNRITYPASEDDEPYGEANTYRRER